ncbi:Tn7 transposase TnsA N-terminal domain-containing protein [Methylobacterium sp. J-070]|uniref:Tn7 transposase TnsA N-terminal domain-containing protein n=1 Tax=Methylobacterium sp. J-070 TaxID=2836650 RepID=UPI001FB9CE69|nr:Tn7 transposase TnsA N-terminal domain-containing protein [Methylobacterium sp. J-070]MCJ2050528.1 Tn7 transposase TnsA N-terminal domain-containing protein [Methylobacterium sp. J-070]
MPKFKGRPGRSVTKSKPPEERFAPLGPGVEVFRLPEWEAVRRIITRGGGRKVGGHFSWKMAGHVVYESGPEERCARLMDVHSSVQAFYAQPETIRVSTDGAKPFRYTPDFLAIISGAEARVEVKRECDLRPAPPAGPSDERGRRRWERAWDMRARLRDVRAAYRRCGLLWVLLLDTGMAAMGDPDIVDELISQGGRHITEADRVRLRDHLVASGGTSTLGAAAEVVREASDPRGTVLARVSEGALAVDLHTPLDHGAAVVLVR